MGIYSFTVLESEPSKSRCQQGQAFFEGAQKRSNLDLTLWFLVLLGVLLGIPQLVDATRWP